MHKVLKDETRRKIVLLLNEKGSVSYTEMMQALSVGSTGTLNYHLKVLADLLTKDEAGQYTLTEKGKLASRLLLEFPEKENQEQTKKKWWKRFWVVAVVLQATGLAFMLALYFLGAISVARMTQGLFAFVSGIVFIYFYYRMIRPPNQKQSEENPPRTIEDIFVSGRTLREVKEEVHRWIAEEGITVEMERDDFVRGRLGIPSGLGLTAPKYFEIALKSDNNGVMVHTEGWISMFDVSEKSFSNSILTYGSLPRRKGWKVMENLWLRLKDIEK
ncbi:MAG: winged helix-turn-helix domain-containing protein [Candidatus Bathyarchaeota archaeon]|nr:winged helix-turn-helix domain-containing protein [Candidatus Bathyarchaeota archaeon]